MKVLLVYVNNISEGYLPIGLASIAAVIKREGHQVNLFDTSFYKTSRPTDREIREKYYEFKKIKKEEEEKFAKKDEVQMYNDWIEKIDSFKPDIISVSVTSTEFPAARVLLQIAKEKFPQITTLVGGTHPTVAPKKVIKENAVDMICIGEGELAIAELLKKMENKEDYTSIENFWIKKDGRTYKNELRPLIQDLDELPYPLWELFDKRHFIRPFEGSVRHHGFFEFGRGCPHSCTYCINRYMQGLYSGKGKYHREKSVNRMIKEIKECRKKVNIDHIFFVDDQFLSINPKKLQEFADRYQKEINVTSMVMARPEAITTHTMEVLKKIKTVMVMMGLESGSKEIREKICKRFMNEKFLFKAVKLLRENNVDSSMYNIVGFPTETRKQVFETIKLNHALKPNRMTVKILCPFEGTEMRDLAIEKGYITDEDDITAMYYDESCLDMPQLSPEDIKGLRKTFILYAKSPKFMWPLIKICENETPFANKIYKALSNSYWMKK